MPKVNFYILKQGEELDRCFFACRLVEKLHAQGHKIFIHTASEQAADQLDDLLWSFKPESFIPHAITGMSDEEDTPVLLGTSSQYPAFRDVLINLSESIPALHTEFSSVVEIVANNEDAKKISRERWNTYKKNGCELNHHQM